MSRQDGVASMLIASAAAPTAAGKKKATTAGKPTTAAAKPKTAGRKTKNATDEKLIEDAPVTSKKRGRTSTKTEYVVDPPRKRRRPPKGGETTKVHVDEMAAEQQLEEELLETAADAAGGAAAKSEKGAEVKSEKGEQQTTAPSSGRNYWLMKAEQEDREEKTFNGTVINTKFTIDDLAARKKEAGPELWDGVRNPVAAKHMREMKTGDLAFFYASGGKQGRTPGIVGLMEVVEEAKPDPTCSDPGAYGYVEDEKQRGRWVVVGVQFRKKFEKPVGLKELQKHGGQGGRLEGMQLFRQTRLSVAKVRESEWDFIMGELVGK